MGKSKAKKFKNVNRHNPLENQILETKYAQPSARQKTRRKEFKDGKYVNEQNTSEIIKLAREQQEDLENELGCSSPGAPHSSLGSNEDTDESDEYEYMHSEDENLGTIAPEISEDDQRAFNNFFVGAGAENRVTLIDIIKETLTEKKTEICTTYSDAGTDIADADVKAYKKLVPYLSNYTSGQLPKHFKCIPNCHDWERRVCLTEPDKWSRATVFQATRIFTSNLTDKMAQRFLNRILLPRLRDEIAECKKLNFHLYQALKKALFKPAAFFKGIIIPLCKAGDCTLREATIFGSVIAKMSIPVLHSSAALITVAEGEYNGATSIIMRNLIEKKYALPIRVVNAVVDHFVRFKEVKTNLPLLWHHCLLSFVQIYKLDLSPEQKTNLQKLLKLHYHEHVTPEILKELKETEGVPNALQQLYKLTA